MTNLVAQLISFVIVVQPTVTISWNMPTNSILPVTNVAVYSGSQVEKETFVKNLGLTNSVTVPVTTGQNQFWWIRTQNSIGQLSQ